MVSKELDATLSAGLHLTVAIRCTYSGASYALAVRSEVVDVLEGTRAAVIGDDSLPP